MSLGPGTRLGSYEIVALLGSGGMGAVYRARDSKLGRAVAIKVIQPAFAADPDRIARFEREAKVLASITHHHIAALYGMEHADGQHFLVMELVEGETLDARIARAPMSIEEALPVSIQICEALEAAHEQGIVHRDLKPANVKITPDDRVKVLDFGLAKAVEQQPVSAGNLANSPTMSLMASGPGLVLGTAAYMSPEQAKGLPADHRSDIFSFGILLSEVLTGSPPFHGETASDIMASILARDPDLGRLEPDLNPRLAHLLGRCLEKNPKRRWQAIGDVRAELETIALAPRVLAQTITSPAVRPLWRRALPILMTAVIAGALGALMMWRLAPPAAGAVTRFSISLPPGVQFTSAGRHTIALSPDGSRIVYNGLPGGLFVRALGELEPTPVTGSATGRVTEPVISPDGLSVAYFATGEQTLKRVPLAGGTPTTICRAANPAGMSWEGDSLLYATGSSIRRVSASGGEPETLIDLKGEFAHGPHLLPDGDRILFTVAPAASAAIDIWDDASIVVQSTKTGQRSTLIERGADASYLSTGHLLYVVGGTLFAIRFDPATARVSGGAVAMVDGVRRALTGAAAANYSVASNGTLAYVSGPSSANFGTVQMGIADLRGGIQPLPLPPRDYEFPRVSPDGLRVAYNVGQPQANVEIYSLAGDSSPRRLTLDGQNRAPIWSPDGRRVVYQSDRDGGGLYAQAADGTGAVERLTKSDPTFLHWPESWSPDGKTILFRIERVGGGSALSMLSLPDRSIVPFPKGESPTPTDARFSPDGHWVAYVRGAQARTALYVQPFPPTGAEYELATARGHLPAHAVWSTDGASIAYCPTPSGFFSVAIKTTPSFSFGLPVHLFDMPLLGQGRQRRQFDVLPNGKLLVLAEGGMDAARTGAPPIYVVLNWFNELRARVPGR